MTSHFPPPTSHPPPTTHDPQPTPFITFDCYGTLVDWEDGIAGAFISAARQDGVDLDRERVLELYGELEPLAQSLSYRTYREILTDVARQCAPRLGWALDDSRAGFLAESLATWQPFPDTNEALSSLKSMGYKLGILSNIDDDLFDATRGHLSVEFDLVITAQKVGSYKPGFGHFDAAREQIGDRPWLHAAQSYFHDVEPATKLKIPVVWVNRTGAQRTGSARPDGEVSSLSGLVDWLGERS